MVELNDANDVYYIRIWLGQEEATPTDDYDNNSAFYFLSGLPPVVVPSVYKPFTEFCSIK